MIVWDGNFALGCGPEIDYPYIYIYIFQCMLERTDAITYEVLPDLHPDAEGRNRWCLWKEGFVHVPNCKSFFVSEAEREHVR
jgi:hypothetical protein